MKKVGSHKSQVFLLNQSGGSALAAIIILLLCCGVLYFAASKHIVKTSDGIKIYPKKSITLKNTYVDMTSLSFLQLRKYKEVVAAMASRGDLQYVPGGRTLIKATKAGHAISEAITKFDNEYQLSKSLNELARIGQDKFREFDSKYDVSGKVDKTRDLVKEKANEFNKWLKKQ